MKLLFDENLSHRLVRLLTDVFPDSVHVRDVGLQAADDSEVLEILLRKHAVTIEEFAQHDYASFLTLS